MKELRRSDVPIVQMVNLLQDLIWKLQMASPNAIYAEALSAMASNRYVLTTDADDFWSGHPTKPIKVLNNKNEALALIATNQKEEKYAAEVRRYGKDTADWLAEQDAAKPLDGANDGA